MHCNIKAQSIIETAAGEPEDAGCNVKHLGLVVLCLYPNALKLFKYLLSNLSNYKFI